MTDQYRDAVSEKASADNKKVRDSGILKNKRAIRKKALAFLKNGCYYSYP